MNTPAPNGMDLLGPAASPGGREQGFTKEAMDSSKTMPDTVFDRDLRKLMPLLITFSASLCRDRELAKDLAQEALCKAWQARNTFRHGTNLKAWLFTILRNVFYSYRRRAWRHTSLDGVPMEKICGPDNPQEWAAAASDVVRALHTLSHDQRQAVILAGMAGLPYADAALVSGCRIGTVKSRVARARQAALKALENPNALSVPRPPAGGAEHELMQLLANAHHR